MKTLRNPPITEAIIDIRCGFSTDVTAETLEHLHDHIQTQYPKKKTKRAWQAQFSTEEEQAPSGAIQDLGVNGFIFWSDDEKQAVQYRLDGFTFSRLRPYQDWKTFSQEAKRLWQILVTKTEPISLSRLAVRYINTIEIPAGKIQISQYFRSAPQLPPEVSATIGEFLSRQVLRFEEENTNAIVTLARPPTATPVGMQVLFDIDIYSEIGMSPNDDKIWHRFEALRKIKNLIFEKCLAEKAMELFE